MRQMRTATRAIQPPSCVKPVLMGLHQVTMPRFVTLVLKVMLQPVVIQNVRYAKQEHLRPMQTTTRSIYPPSRVKTVRVERTTLTQVQASVFLAVLDITKIRLDRWSVLTAPQAATVRTRTMLNVSCVPRGDLSQETRRVSVSHVSREIT